MSGNHKIAPRPYQLELLDAAIEENTIVVLGTGTGKTFVSVLLIRELQHEILGDFKTHKRTIFLVTTVPLVAQQAEVVRSNLGVIVGEFKGDHKIDSWSQSMWLSKFKEYHVLVMTAQIFVNILLAGFIPLNKINLVIFDECHHATKDHPYAQVMRFFDPSLSDQLPRVVGLTAALVQGKCRAFEVEKRITQLEKVLQCRAQTSRDLVTVHKYATRPDEHLIKYDSSQDNQDEFINVLTMPIQFLAEFSKGSKSTTYDYVKDMLVDCNHVLEEIGSSILFDFLEKCLNDLEMNKRGVCKGSVDEALINLCCTHLLKFQKLYLKQIKSGMYVTSKLKGLLQILEDFGIKNGESGNTGGSVPARDKLCGIIFVQQRSTALALAQVLRILSNKKRELQYIRCDYIVGHGPSQSHNGVIAKMADMTTAKQQEVLSRFRSHKINLLVSTSVVEEGLDVPQCNLVVRYSLPGDVCSYLQSRGRARATNSQYDMLVDDKDAHSFRGQLGDMQAVERLLERLCHGRHVPDVGDDESEDSLDDVKSVDEIIPPFLPHGEGTQIRATAASSIQSLYMYCQRLPSDDFYHPVPIFRISKQQTSFCQDSMYGEVMRGSIQYQCTITMPISCPLLDPILGHPMDSAKLAKHDAAVEAIRLLYDAKELNDSLLPISVDNIEGTNIDDMELQEEKKIVDAGTIRRKQRYQIQGAQLLSECQPIEKGINYLYMMKIHSDDDQSPHSGEEIRSYGIITSKVLPPVMLNENDVTLYSGNKKLKVTVHQLDELVKLDSTEWNLIMRFQHVLFDEILCVKGSHFEFKIEQSLKRYIVVPITIIAGFDPVVGLIDYNLMQNVVHNCVPVKWPCSPSEYVNSLVMVNHRNDTDPDRGFRRLYYVTKAHADKSPRSSFPDGQGITFQEFYHSKYNYNFTDLNQPLLEVRYASMRLEHLTPRYSQSSVEEDVAQKTQQLFPEICEVHPLPGEMYNRARLLPSYLYRLESILSAHELITGVKLSFYGSDTSFKSPSCSLVVQALTLQGAQDSFNLERLEILGDAFLKMITTVSLHAKLSATTPVSVLTCRRSEMFSNIRLYLLAKRKQIPSKMRSTVFKARNMWIPPGYKLKDGGVGTDNEQYNSQMLPDKRVADCVEALIGAYIAAGGVAAGIKFLEWLEFFEVKPAGGKANASLPLDPHQILLNGNALEECFRSSQSDSQSRQPENAEAEKKLFAGLDRFNRLWRFHDQYILLQALTHVSYSYNRITGSYQRLELLGDAILDYLITTHIYCAYPNYDEGKVTLLRSAIVSNTTLALLALVHDFHKAVKHNSPKLFAKIGQFCSASTEVVNQLKIWFGGNEDIVCYELDDDQGGEDEDIDMLDAPKVLADIVESLVGAVFMDSNMNLATVWSVFEPLFRPFIDKFSRKLPVSPVRRLLETDIGSTATFRKHKCADQDVECVVKIKGKGIVVSAMASNYKAAKKAAAKKVLSQLM